MTKFTLPPDPVSRRFQALADPTRRAIIERLVKSPAAVSELAAPFDMALPTVLSHLRVLETSGLIATVKSGRVRTCTIEPDGLRGLEDWLRERIVMWENRLDRFDAFVLTLAEKETPDARPEPIARPEPTDGPGSSARTRTT